MCTSWQRECRRPDERPGSYWVPVQHCAFALLTPIRPLGSTEQHRAEATSTIYLDIYPLVELGNCRNVCPLYSMEVLRHTDHDRLMGLVQGFGGLVAARFCLGIGEVSFMSQPHCTNADNLHTVRFFACSNLFVDNLVSTLRDPNTHGNLLRIGIAFWSVLRTVSICDPEDGWRRRA